MAECSQHLVIARAFCEDCDWDVDAKNAQGVAAQHAQRNGHTVTYELTYHGTAVPE